MAFNDMFKVFDTKYVSNDEINKIPSFMFLKWLSNHPGTVLAANSINRYYNEIPMVNQFYMIRNGFKGKKVFIKFLKQDKNKDNTLLLIQKYYKLDTIKAQEYYSLMSENEINELVEMYKDIK